MSSKSSATSKRTTIPRQADRTKAFKKDWQRLSHSGKHDMNRLKEPMMLIIANSEPLPPEWLDHALDGEWADHRELHAKGDLLLIYKLEDEGDRVIFVRAGTHSELLE